MKTLIKLLIITLISTLPYSCINEEPAVEEVITVGDTLPDFTITMSDGSSITGKTLRSSTSLIMFFHTGCPDCRKVLPHIQRLYNMYNQQAMTFTLISREEDEASVSNYWGKQGFSMPYSAQNDRRIYELFAYRRVPRIYISEHGGIVRHTFTDNPTPTFEMLNEAMVDVLK